MFSEWWNSYHRSVVVSNKIRNLQKYNHCEIHFYHFQITCCVCECPDNINKKQCETKIKDITTINSDITAMNADQTE